MGAQQDKEGSTVTTNIAPTATPLRRTYRRSTRRAVSRRRLAASSRPTADEWLTVDEVCTELKIGRRTFERWRALGTAPRAKRLAGNGPLRIRRSWLDDWMEDGA
jgi:excisionase family DNA binding protein